MEGSARNRTKPHVLFFLADDLGWAEVGFNHPKPTEAAPTRTLNNLAAEGVRLGRHYMHAFCSPSRSAIQSGRAPLHVNAVNSHWYVSNSGDPVGGFAGVPRNMTGLGSVMQRGGYATHYVGKWDAGSATPDHTPLGRGYQTSLHYFTHEIDYWTFKTGSGALDLWQTDRPAPELVNHPGCTEKSQRSGPRHKCTYADSLFEERVHAILDEHDQRAPLFLFWAPHLIHGPMQVPFDELDDGYTLPDSACHSKGATSLLLTKRAMVKHLDASLGRVVQRARDNGMWSSLLLIFASDNGGSRYTGGNNFPLRGGKKTNWEGGIRVPALVSGGFVPLAVRGTVESGLTAGWDWYRTLAGLAQVDVHDRRAEAAGLPAVEGDSHDLWPLLSGREALSPRTQILLATQRCPLSMCEIDEDYDSGHRVMIGGVIEPPFKLVLGETSTGTTTAGEGWSLGPHLQDVQSCKGGEDRDGVTTCGRTSETGCLFNLYDDPGEQTNLARAMPMVFNRMYAAAVDASKTVYSPYRGQTLGRDALETRLVATNASLAFVGPFLP